MSRTHPMLRVLLVAALLTPLAIWVIAWALTGWSPQGDEAVIALKTHDVFSAHPPLLGMRSTSAVSVPGVWAHHPGPIEFYMLAVPYAASGWAPIGLLIGCWLIAATFIGIAIGHAYALARWRAAAAVAVVIAALEVAFGPVLVLPWNPWPAVLGLVPVAVLAWRLVLGEHRVLPVFVGVVSVVAQTNLVMLPVLAPLVLALLVIGAARVQHVGVARLRTAPRTVWRPVALAIVVAVVLWLPAGMDVALDHPNNVSEIWRLTTGGGGSGVIGPVVLLAVVVAVAVRAVDADSLGTWQGARLVGALLVLGGLLAALSGGQGRTIYLYLAAAAPLFVVVSLRPGWVPRPRNPRRAIPVWFVAAAALGVLVAPGVFPSAVTRIQIIGYQRCARAADVALAVIARDAPGRQAVMIRTDGSVQAQVNMSAVVLTLVKRGQPVFYDLPAPFPFTDRGWPEPEDDDYRHLSHAPSDALTIQLRGDGTTIGELPGSGG